MEPKTIIKFPSFDQHLARIFVIIQEKLFAGIPCYIAGGAARKLYLKEELANSDIDIWFQNAEDLQKAATILYENPAVTIKAETDNGFTYSLAEHTDNPLKIEVKIQLISRNYYSGDVSEVFGDFDFTICQVVYNNGRLILSEDAVRDMRDMNLRLNERYTGPLSTARFLKYMNYGYVPTIKSYNAFFLEGRNELHQGDLIITEKELYYG
jgi:hypothetical protein